MLRIQDTNYTTFEHALNSYLAIQPKDKQFHYRSLFYTPLDDHESRIIDVMGKCPLEYFTYEALERKLFNLSIRHGDIFSDLKETLQALCSKIFIYTLNQKYENKWIK